MDWISVDLREANLHDSLAYVHEFCMKAMKISNPEQGSSMKEEVVLTSTPWLHPPDPSDSVKYSCKGENILIRRYMFSFPNPVYGKLPPPPDKNTPNAVIPAAENSLLTAL